MRSRVSGYTRMDRGKVIRVPSHLREVRAKGKGAKGDNISWNQKYVPTRSGKIKVLKTPIKISYRATRYKNTGEFRRKK